MATFSAMQRYVHRNIESRHMKLIAALSMNSYTYSTLSKKASNLIRRMPFQITNVQLLVHLTISFEVDAW